MTQRLMEELTEREHEILRLISEGASDREIAQKLYLSVNTIKWHNRQIYQKLDVKSRSEAVAKATELDLLDKGADQKPAEVKTPQHNLPAQISSFIGREKEIAQIKKLLETNRLVTITGPGGVGKTRLALKVAEELLLKADFSDGIFLVELAAINQSERVYEAIRDGLGLSFQSREETDEKLKTFLSDQKILLQLDNFEHILDAAPLIGELLGKAPDLYILTTSREELHLRGEQVYPLSPLKISGLDSSAVDSEAVELFIQRAREANPKFNTTDEDLEKIVEICTRLDGLPLAIELAAVRLNIFSVSSLLDQLDDRFAILKGAPQDVPARHQTLHNAIQWSYDLLEEEEQILFMRLAVFQGSRTIDAVNEIGCFDLKIDAIGGLESLLFKNLLKQEEGIDGEPRFYMLETIHKYAQDRLTESGNLEDLRMRHAHYFIDLIDQAKEPLRGGPNQDSWLNKLVEDYENIRKVYLWTFDNNEVNLRLQLVAGLINFWIYVGYHRDGKEWVADALVHVSDSPLPLKAEVYSAAASMYFLYHDFSRSLEFREKSLDCYLMLENIREIGWCHIRMMGPLKYDLLDEERIMDHFNQGVDLLTEIGDKKGVAQAWINFGVYAYHVGNYELARDAFYRSLMIGKENSDKSRDLLCMVNIASADLKLGDPESAQKILLDVLKKEIEYDQSIEEIWGTFELMAGPALALGKPRRAVVLLGKGNSLRGQWGEEKFHHHHEFVVNEFILAAEEELGHAAYQAAWDEGQAMSLEEAIAFALEGDRDDP